MLRLESLQSPALPAFRSLLGSSDFGGCFCAVWTSHDEAWVKRCGDPAQPNYFVTEARVKAGGHCGYLVYEDAELVGWTGSGPKPSFPFLARKLASRLSPSIDTTWSIGCLAIKSEWRGKGLAERIVHAVLDEAARSGAKTIEAYPVRPTDEARVFRGSYKMYERCGFAIKEMEKDEDSEILLMYLLLPGTK